MNRFRGGAALLLAGFVLLYSGPAALAQSADGVLDTLRGLVGDPALGSLLMSKFGSPSSLLGRPNPPQDSGFGSQPQPSASGYSAANEEPGQTFPFQPIQSQPFQSQSLAGQQSPYLRGIEPADSFAPPGNGTGPGSGFNSFGQVQAFDGGNDPNQKRPYLAQIPSISGSRYASPSSGAPFGPANMSMTITNRLAPAELRQLSRYDISVLIDKSGSMSTRDCPSQFQIGRNVSRWEWCREQSAVLMQQTAGALPSGIAIIPFAGNWQRYDNVTPGGINSIFNYSAPNGSTNLAGALQSELDRYFRERQFGGSRQPRMIAVITDGVPDSKSAVRRVIRAATEQMRNPDEIKIVFFMIGQDPNGADFVDELSGRLANEGARFSIVSEHPFAEVNQLGLARSLAGSAMQ